MAWIVDASVLPALKELYGSGETLSFPVGEMLSVPNDLFPHIHYLPDKPSVWEWFVDSFSSSDPQLRLLSL